MPHRELEVLEAAGDLAEGVAGDLAVLGREVRRELLAVRLDEVPDPEHDLGPLRSEVARQAGKAAFAAATARLDLLDRGEVDVLGDLARSPGRRPGPRGRTCPATSRPPIQWLTRPAAGASGRAAPGSATCVIGIDLVLLGVADQAVTETRRGSSRYSACRADRPDGAPAPAGLRPHSLGTAVASPGPARRRSCGDRLVRRSARGRRIVSHADDHGAADRDPDRDQAAGSEPERHDRVAPGGRDHARGPRAHSPSPTKNSRPSRRREPAEQHQEDQDGEDDQRGDPLVRLRRVRRQRRRRASPTGPGPAYAVAQEASLGSALAGRRSGSSSSLPAPRTNSSGQRRHVEPSPDRRARAGCAT